MEVLLELASKEINELAAALAKAHSEMETAEATKVLKHLNSRYADLNDITSAARPALSKNGLAVVQRELRDTDGQIILSTVLMHTSGQWIESRLPIMAENPKNMQEIGKSIKYTRRYAYSTITGILIEDEAHDYRGGYNQQQKNYQASKPAPAAQAPEVITREQLEQLNVELNGHADLMREVMTGLKIKSLNEMKRADYARVMKHVQQTKTKTQTTTV
jgi:hypothetical protein